MVDRHVVQRSTAELNAIVTVTTGYVIAHPEITHRDVAVVNLNAVATAAGDDRSQDCVLCFVSAIAITNDRHCLVDHYVLSVEPDCYHHSAAARDAIHAILDSGKGIASEVPRRSAAVGVCPGRGATPGFVHINCRGSNTRRRCWSR